MTAKNIIIIIGNGFDKAHGLQTSFPDFANYFIEKKIVPRLKEVIIHRQRKTEFFKKEFIDTIIKKNGYYDEQKTIDIIWLAFSYNRVDEIVEYLKSNPSEIKEIIQNTFLGKLYSNSYKNWFDIENAYFYELVQLKNEALKKRSVFNKNKLISLNREFLEIKTELSEYLKTIQTVHKQEIQEFFDRYIRNVTNVYIINFNYTNTIEPYLKGYGPKQLIRVNYIHGSLAEDNIIFGYGNDKNSNYQEIKSLEIDEFLTFFKTFEYQRSPNYVQVYNDAIKAFREYDVLVLGHSLGTTDKTLLSEIFNPERCKKVSIFKRKDLEGKTDEVFGQFIKLTYAASRIFANEETLRKTLSNFKQSAFFP